jgi:hypothetical protein
MNKYGAKRTFSVLCDRWFHSKAEAIRGEELALLERVGEISNLEYQVKFVLSQNPRVTISIDFAYDWNGDRIYEDTKGVLTRDFRTKLAWLKGKYNIDVMLSKGV